MILLNLLRLVEDPYLTIPTPMLATYKAIKAKVLVLLLMVMVLIEMFQWLWSP